MFRTEALQYRADRLSGDVAIAVPVPWQAIGYLVFGGVAAGITGRVRQGGVISAVAVGHRQAALAVMCRG